MCSTSGSSSSNNAVLPSTVEANGKVSDYNEGLIPVSSSPSLNSADMHGGHFFLAGTPATENGQLCTYVGIVVFP